MLDQRALAQPATAGCSPEVPTILLANPRGFCAGVERAIRIVELALDRGRPVYVRHEIVHNRTVVDSLKDRGAVFVDELDQVPDGATVIFSAHGVPRSVEAEAARRGLHVLDATCPLVAKVHREVRSHVARGRHVVLIGHAGHPEVIGTLGQVARGDVTLIEQAADIESLPGDLENLAYATQTTLSVDDATETIAALKSRFPGVVGPSREDICYATTNRQEAAKTLARRVDLVLVVGSPNSSNSRRLREAAEGQGVPAQLVDGPDAIDWTEVQATTRVGVTAGASAPEASVDAVIEVLRVRLGVERLEEIPGPVEDATFALPPELRR